MGVSRTYARKSMLRLRMAEGCMDNQDGAITLRSFICACFIQATRGSWERADLYSVVVGLVLGTVAYFIPATEGTLTHFLLIVPLVSLASVTLFRFFLSPFLVYRNRDAIARKAENELRTVIASHEETIQQRDQTIQVLNAKPKRSAPDQYNYDRAKAFLDKQGARRAKFVAALQQLYTHGDLTYSVMGITMNTTWPKGMDRNEAIPIYDACVTEGLAMQEIPGVHPARKISIAPAMTNVLSELLY
jgi:hypothetical protein